MGLNRWLGAILVVSTITWAGCSGPKPQGYQTGTPVAQTTTIPPVTTPEPAATPAADASGTPVAQATGAAPAAGGEDDFANAEGMTGYEETLALTPPPSTPESIAKGKELFSTNCATCHGPDGKGDGPAGAALDPPPRNLHVPAEFKYGAGDRAMYRTAFYGIDGTGMAPMEGILTTDEVWNVVHYVHTLQGT